MRRKQILQIINSNYCPRLIKKLVSEFLSWFVLKTNATKAFLPVINDVLHRSNTKSIVNLELDIGAGINTVQPFLAKNITVKSLLKHNWNTHNKGVYTFVNCFHQLPVNKAKQHIEAIVKSDNPIVVVEGNNDSLWQIIGMTIFVPLTVLLTSVFVKPFQWTRILFTYLIPILPIIIMVDGCIALLKLYNPSDLKTLVSSIDYSKKYSWDIGKKPNGRGGKIIYLKGMPK